MAAQHMLLVCSVFALLLECYALRSATHGWRPIWHNIRVKVSKDECLSDVECPKSKYCGSVKSAPLRCLERLNENAVCTSVSGQECKEQFYCGFSEKLSGSNPICIRKVRKGGKCRLDAVRPCQGNLVCRRSDSTCQENVLGLNGDICRFDRDCQQQKGFYCKKVKEFSSTTGEVRQCSPKKKAGELCDQSTDNFECLGFCGTFRGHYPEKPSCQRRRNAGEACTANAQCRTVLLPLPRTNDFLCNTKDQYDSTGICVLETELITKLGEWCNPRADKCDARRNLRCRFRFGAYRCVQIGKEGDLCTPGSPLSKCIAVYGAPLQCRPERKIHHYGFPRRVDRCLRVREIVRRGQICNRAEYSVCEKGTVCTTAPGVQNRFGRRPPPRLALCMKVVPAGGDCSDFLRTTCAKGSSCVNGICKSSQPPTSVPIKYATLDNECSKLPCVPGLVCKKPTFDPNRKYCSLPEITVGLWKPCFRTATTQKACPAAAHCARGFFGRGILRCRPLGRIGSVCMNDKGCKGNLKCGPVYKRDFYRVQRCYDPKKSLPQGAKCNPFARRYNRQCVLAVNPYRPLRCLPKGRSFACQGEAYLFEFCSPRKNIACASKKLVCSSSSLCVPRR